LLKSKSTIRIHKQPPTITYQHFYAPSYTRVTNKHTPGDIAVHGPSMLNVELEMTLR
jgi:hypothetical protein